MEVRSKRCCGIDVHRRSVGACVIVPGAEGRPHSALTFHEEELLKIKKATSGSFTESARHAVARALGDLKPKIDSTRTLPDAERWQVLKQLGNDATAKRDDALQAGAWNRGHPQWAAAAACESWVYELLLGSPDSIARVEQIIDDLSRRD